MRCASCAGPLWELSHKWRIPKKEDDKAWRELKQIVQSEAPQREANLNRMGTRLLKEIEDRLDTVSKQKISERRDRMIKLLKKEMRDVMQSYFPDAKSSMTAHTNNTEQFTPADGHQPTVTNPIPPCRPAAE